MKSFIHSGDRGDIIYGLPVIRHHGPGVLHILPAPFTRVNLTPDKWCGLDVLLREQPYIEDVVPMPVIDPIMGAININKFRLLMDKSLRRGINRDTSLTDWMLAATNTPPEAKDEPWLQVSPNRQARVVVNRSGAARDIRLVYQNRLFPWGAVAKKFFGHAIFIGTTEEHEEFCAVVGEIPFYPTADLYEAARVIAGADLFIGNQSAPAAIAEGLKKRIILEVWPQGPNCLFFREGVTHGWTQKTPLPEL